MTTLEELHVIVQRIQESKRRKEKNNLLKMLCNCPERGNNKNFSCSKVDMCDKQWDAIFTFKDGHMERFKDEYWNDALSYHKFDNSSYKDKINYIVITGNAKITTHSVSIEELGLDLEIIYFKNQEEFQKLTKDQKAKVMAALI